MFHPVQWRVSWTGAVTAHAPERMLEIPRTGERREERQKIDLEVYIVRKIKWEEENQKKRRRRTKREGRRGGEGP